MSEYKEKGKKAESANLDEAGAQVGVSTSGGG